MQHNNRAFLLSFLGVMVCLFGIVSSALAAPAILSNPTGSYGVWTKGSDGNFYNGAQQNYAISADPSMLNGYQGNTIAQDFTTGQYYVQLKSGGWVDAPSYTPELDNPPLPAPVPQSQNGGQNGENSEPISATLCIIAKALQGSIGKAIATIAIVVLGVGMFLGKLSWPLAVAIAIGIGLIFGSSEMVSWLSNQSNPGC